MDCIRALLRFVYAIHVLYRVSRLAATLVS
jgi:hypothetical protein